MKLRHLRAMPKRRVTITRARFSFRSASVAAEIAGITRYFFTVINFAYYILRQVFRRRGIHQIFLWPSFRRRARHFVFMPGEMNDAAKFRLLYRLR